MTFEVLSQSEFSRALTQAGKCAFCGDSKPVAVLCLVCGELWRAGFRDREKLRQRLAVARKEERIALGIHDGFRKRGAPELNLRAAAHKFTRAAVENGFLLAPKDCKCTDCAKQATCYDHRDYGRPMDVEPVCLSCNSRRRTGFMPPLVVDFTTHAKPTEARAA